MEFKLGTDIMIRRILFFVELLVLILFLKGSTCYFYESDASASGEQKSFAWEDYPAIAHALGGLEGYTYLNSAEAFENAHAMGCRLFEADVRQT